MAIDIRQIENTIGYSFRNKDLLQQAFVRRSYSQENGGQNNEVLELDVSYNIINNQLSKSLLLEKKFKKRDK